MKTLWNILMLLIGTALLAVMFWFGYETGCERMRAAQSQPDQQAAKCFERARQ